MFKFADPPPFVTPQVGWPLVITLWVILVIVILVSLRRRAIGNERKRRETFKRKSLVEYANFDTRFTEELFKKPGSLKGFPYNPKDVKDAFSDQTRTDHH